MYDLGGNVLWFAVHWIPINNHSGFLAVAVETFFFYELPVIPFNVSVFHIFIIIIGRELLRGRIISQV